jgi:hypothetical protein
MELNKFSINNPEIHNIDYDLIKVADISSHILNKDYTFTSSLDISEPQTTINETNNYGQEVSVYDDLDYLAEDISRDGQSIENRYRKLGDFTLKKLYIFEKEELILSNEPSIIPEIKLIPVDSNAIQQYKILEILQERHSNLLNSYINASKSYNKNILTRLSRRRKNELSESMSKLNLVKAMIELHTRPK